MHQRLLHPAEAKQVAMVVDTTAGQATQATTLQLQLRRVEGELPQAHVLVGHAQAQHRRQRHRLDHPAVRRRQAIPVPETHNAPRAYSRRSKTTPPARHNGVLHKARRSTCRRMPR